VSEQYRPSGRKETPEEYRRRKAASAGPSVETTFVENLLTGIWNLIKWLFGKKGGSGSGRSAQLKALGENWGNVEMHLMQPGAHMLAVSEGDKLLDQALKLSGVSGETMGERLKGSEKLFGQDLYQRIWEAHKLRNVLAHEVGAAADKQQAQWAVSIFREALTKLGVL
jgi:hypothetical protein